MLGTVDVRNKHRILTLKNLAMLLRNSEFMYS